MGLTNLIEGFRVLGLEAPAAVAPDISFENISGKITNPTIALAMGAERSLPFIENAEWCANLLDSFSESGNWGFVLEAQQRYSKLLAELPSDVRATVSTAVASAFNYFSYEQHMAMRIRRGDRFAFEEALEYLFRRGSDSSIYVSLLIGLDDLYQPGFETGFRIRQALWDLRDDITDLEQDRRSVGANILLLTDSLNLCRLATSLQQQAAAELPHGSPLIQAINQEFELVSQML